eukprot:11165909-Lingulodinium_polyedra.AAC.1
MAAGASGVIGETIAVRAAWLRTPWLAKTPWTSTGCDVAAACAAATCNAAWTANWRGGTETTPRPAN